MVTVTDKDIFFAKMREGATIPTKKDEDAGYDMHACFDEDFFVIEPHATALIPSGIAMAYSKKYYAQLEERSSMAKLGIKRSGGVIDSGYRGEYIVTTYNTNNKPFIITKISEEELPNKFIVNGKKYKKKDVILYPYTKAVCQVIMQEVPALTSKELSYEELKAIPSARGTGGFGHSKK